MTNTTLPATFAEADLEDMVGTVAHWIDVVANWLTSEASRQRMRQEIHEAIRAGTLPLARVIEAARAGHGDADLALRARAKELLDNGELGKESSALLRAYAIEALDRAPVSYPPGRNLADTWLRDIGIAVVVSLTALRWNLLVTRNEATTGPSASYVVALALARRRHIFPRQKPPGERQVERIFGEHNRLATRLSASLPRL